MAEIRRGPKKPVYLLHGQEGYFIDRLAEAFEQTVPDDMKSFNLYTFYAPETDPETIIRACKSFPMMGERQIVIVKEAQAVRADQINKLHTYVSNPSSTTVLVICFRGSEAKGKDLLAAVRKGGYVNFESKKIYESNLPRLIESIVREQGLNIEAKGISMLADFIGTDASRLYGEIQKLAMILQPNSLITPEVIENNIGISKDYNNFELCDALSTRNGNRALTIISYFRSNPKNNPTVLTVAALFDYFAGLLCCHWGRGMSPADKMKMLGAKSSFQMKRYDNGVRTYSPTSVLKIISDLRDFDRKSKGVGSRQNEYDLLYTLILKILYS
ncbi:MAG: DNA polymerase III subunit delta [Paramuribaculum sp.]|nr:DNA polymerase III subunit delta [Bacteroides sp.]MDE6825907.1 DNA polymerase III subunit delta [Paramuribaculum sp.]MDE7471711.1 DNA polymerase III subunit delta [Paramuribaculum sp.]